MAYAPSEDLDQPWHPPSLIRVFTVHMKKDWVLNYPLSAVKTDQTGRMPRLIWVFAGRTDHFVGFVMRWLNYSSTNVWAGSTFFAQTRPFQYLESLRYWIQMHHLVSLQRAVLVERFITNPAGIRFLSSMNSLVTIETSLCRKRFRTKLTFFHLDAHSKCMALVSKTS